ncbi:MAG TPA: pyruvate dehydrogenase (acetyl-transferring) E1 component subunit alpha [Gammaproteobacteria bacterium]|nr:pyruvate dehydrogenase (acetyl-transferring) E1 component subunit alpha [Gammaproteobacteria bacterium]
MVKSAESVFERKLDARNPSRAVARFEIRCTRFVDEHGRALAALPAFADDPAELRALYRGCVLTRLFDAKAVALQRTGQLGTYPSSLGQEAVAVAIGTAMRADDVLLPTYREMGAMLMRGVRMTDLLLYWGGDERGMAFAKPAEDFPICVPIATHAPHAVGVAFAIKHRGERRAAVCVLGDGATSKGDFYEALNGAGVWQLPLVFVINNNEWAISLPRHRQSHAETLAQKAIAAGVPGEQVDGNDAVAVRHVLDGALEKARDGGGPQVIEALTYRLADHTTADDARRYRSAEEVQRQQAQDPIERLRKLLAVRGALSEADDAALQAECAGEVERAVTEYLATPARNPATMFDHLFASLPAPLAAQRDEVAKRGRHG